MRALIITLSLLLSLAVAIGCDGGDEMTAAAEPLLILAAASTGDVVSDLADRFSAETGIPVRVSTGGSSALARQVIAGAPADLFLSADPIWAEEIERRGLAAESAPLVSNRLVLVVPEGNPAGVRNPGDLARAGRPLALAGENVPAGRYAEEALRTIGIYAPLIADRRIVRGADVRRTLGYVESGEVSAGVVYATDARITSRVSVIHEFDPDTHSPIVVILVRLSRGEPHPAASRLFAYLRGEGAGMRFEAAGFEGIEP